MRVDGPREGQDLFVDGRKENPLVEACLGWSEHGATCESPCEQCADAGLALWRIEGSRDHSTGDDGIQNCKGQARRKLGSRKRIRDSLGAVVVLRVSTQV